MLIFLPRKFWSMHSSVLNFWKDFNIWNEFSFSFYQDMKSKNLVNTNQEWKLISRPQELFYWLLVFFNESLLFNYFFRIYRHIFQLLFPASNNLFWIRYLKCAVCLPELLEQWYEEWEKVASMICCHGSWKHWSQNEVLLIDQVPLKVSADGKNFLTFLYS